MLHEDYGGAAQGPLNTTGRPQVASPVSISEESAEVPSEPRRYVHLLIGQLWSLQIGQNWSLLGVLKLTF